MYNYTKNGLLLILIGLIISIIGTLLFGLYQFLTPIEHVEDFLQYIWLGIIGGIGGMISLIGVILFFIGRKEFGKKHQQFVIYAIICFIAGIIVSITVSIASTIFMAMSTEGGAVLGFPTASVILPTIISAFTGGLTYIFALYHLEDDTGRKILYIAFIVSIAVSMLIAFLSAGAIEEMKKETSEITSPEDFSSITSFTSSVTQYAIYGSISSVLWAIAIYRPYKRIRDGELIPQPVNVLDQKQDIPERICPNCNQSIPNDANICPYCGKQFKDFI